MDANETHIHNLLDDVLIKILWPSKQSTISCTSENDNLCNFVTAPVPNHLYRHASPEERLYRLRDTPIRTPPASDAAHNLFIASICRRWWRLAQRHVSSLLVKEDRVVSRRDVLNAVACFPNPTRLHLSDGSVETLDDAFLADFTASCPGLRSLHVGKLMMAADDAQHGRRDRFITESGLDYFFRRCPQLEQLSLYCLEEKRLPDSIGEVLPCLQELSISGQSFRDLTDHFTSLTCLESLTISSCPLFTLPENFGNLPALKALVLQELPLCHLPASFTRLASLESFCLLDCMGVEKLPAGFGNLTALQTLSLAWLMKLDLPEDLGGLTNLQIFHLTKNREEQLPASFTQLASLTKLELDRCAIAELPASMAEMTNLQELRIQKCPAIKELPECVTALTSLQVLRVHECRHLSSVPRRLDSLTRLKQLELRGCWLLTELRILLLGTVRAPFLEAMGASLSGLSRVRHLEVGLGEDAEELLTVLTRLPRLRTLTLQEARSLNRLVDSDASALHELRQLNIRTMYENSQSCLRPSPLSTT
ncbi:unnamed protein product [Closterium sp. NIES-54]